MHFFDDVYQGTPLWDTGRPQPAIVRLEESGEIVGRVLDAGCGTGENACFLAGRGHPTVGIDFAPTAIAKARAKAAGRGVSVEFHVGSALELDRIGATFDSAIDCGLFHTFHDEHRARYARSVRSVLVPGGRLFVLCFSEHEPAEWGGPRRVSQAEIRRTFSRGWAVRWMREERFETRTPSIEGRAWLAALERTGARRARGA
jgi:SAM-dependent methyltransferase